ncbi:MAG TPA: HAD family hydrolase [Bacillota bacterium]|nr:HAD family hydrolase [Bacillota bacterium]
MIKAIIFDFDGLILETEQPCYQAWQEIYQAHGGDLDFESYILTIGSSLDHFDPYEHLERTIGHAVDRESIRTLRRQRHLELTETQPILPGVVEYLKEAKTLGLKIALASSSSREWVVGHLTRLGLIDYFDTLKTADDVSRTKPEPDLYLAVLDSLKIKPGEALVLEDSPNGILAANRAGIFSVAIPSLMTKTLNFDHADLAIGSLAELPLNKLLLEVQNKREAAAN